VFTGNTRNTLMLLYYCILHFPSLFFKERDVRRGQGEFVLGKFERWYEKGNLSYPLFLGCKPNCRSEYKWLAGTPTTRAPGLASSPTGIPARQRQFGLHPLFLCALVAKMYLYYFVTVYQRIRSGLYLGHEQSSNNRYWGIFMHRQKP